MIDFDNHDYPSLGVNLFASLLRNAFKRMMVDAQLCSGVVVKSSKDRGADSK